MILRSMLLGVLMSLSSLAFAGSREGFCQKHPTPAYAATRDIILRELKLTSGTCREKAQKLSQMLSIRLTAAGIEELGPFEVFEELLELDLSNNSIKDIRPLLRLPALKTLNLSRNQISQVRIDQKNDSLEELRLSNPKTTQIHLTGLQRLTGLKTLALKDIGLTRISDLGELPENLAVLDLLWNDLTDADELEESLQERVVGFSPSRTLCGEARSRSLPTLSQTCKKLKL